MRAKMRAGKSAGLILGIILAGGIIAWSPAVALAQLGTPSQVNQDQAPVPEYMQPRGPMQIFDAGRGQGETTLLEQATDQLRARRDQRRARVRVEANDIASFHYTLEGADEASVLAEARARALMSAAARVYFGDNILLGLDLLEPYLRRAGSRAVARTDVTGRPRLLANGNLTMPVGVTINLNSLFQDLEAMRFIAEPNIRPRVTIHLSETLGGRPAPEPITRNRIAATMEGELFQAPLGTMREPALNLDLTNDAGRLRTARLEAQRNQIDVVITGSMEANPIRAGQILYDNFHFWEGSLALRMYRVDNGELLAEVRETYSATGDTEPAAIANLLDTLVARTAGRLATLLRDIWPVMMLSEMDYRLLVNGVTDDVVLARVSNLLSLIHPQVRVIQRVRYADVAVLNVVLPEGFHIDMESFLRQSTEPQLIVRRVDQRRFEIEPIN